MRGYFILFDNKQFCYCHTKKEVATLRSLLKWRYGVDTSKLTDIPMTRDQWSRFVHNDSIKCWWETFEDADIKTPKKPQG